MKPPQRVLLIVTRRIGDVLLTTPLLHSLRLAWPEAAIDVLVFRNTEGVLRGNPDIREIITVPEHPGFWRHLRLFLRLFRRYDLALSTLTGDKPIIYAWVAGKRRIGLLAPERKQRWKRRLLSQTVEFDNLDTHTVLMNLKLAEALGIAPSYAVVATWTPQDAAHLAATFMLPLPQGARGFGAENLESQDMQPYAVLHVYPKFAYKTWHVQGWVDLAQWLSTQGMRVLLTGSKDADELAYVEQICKQLPPDTINLAGRLSLSQSACLLSRAKLYVGPDTVMTHIAAAVGAPTVALFGPSNPVKWGPWPQGYARPRNPYRLRGTQRVANVILLQGPGDCVPCMEEGCERHVRSLSDCLQNLTSQEVIAAVRGLLEN